MLYLGSTALAGILKSILITTTRTLTIPNDVYCVWADGCGGGHGGGGGDPTPGGGGGGGGAALACKGLLLSATPGDVWTLTIGAGGNGGAAGADGIEGGSTIITSSLFGQLLNLVAPMGGGHGRKGTASAGGAAGCTIPYGTSVDTYRVSSAPTALPNYMPAEFINSSAISYFPGSAGAALNTAGGSRLAGSISGGIYNAGAAGNASGGGGGHGALGPFAPATNTSGQGGANGAAGANASGYGCGGGGGSGNSSGGNGSPGFLRIYYFSAYSF